MIIVLPLTLREDLKQTGRAQRSHGKEASHHVANDMTKFIQISNILHLRKFYKKAPKLFARASAGMLNNLAFQARSKAIDNISDNMIVRNKRFVSRQMRVDRAFAGPMSSQRAEVGSLVTDRFTGWREQETGESPDRSRSMILPARRGNKQNKVYGGARLNPSANFTTESDVNITNAISADHRTLIFLSMMNRRKDSKPFVMTRKYKGIKKGLYKFTKPGRLKKLQAYDSPPKSNKKQWMKPAKEEVMSKPNIRKQWARAIDRVL